MRGLDKIIESLEVAFIKAKHIRMQSPLLVENFYEVENILLIVNQGKATYNQGQTPQQIKSGDMLFIPGGQGTPLHHRGVDIATWHQKSFSIGSPGFLHPLDNAASETTCDHCSYITFDAKVFNAINLFTFLDISPFAIQGNIELSNTLRHILAECSATPLGYSRIIKAATEQLVIELIRHVMTKGLLMEKLITNSRHLQDLRLIKLLNHIKDNLGGNLSNRMLATVAHVSEDYVGQYFKLLTGTNAQDYIEHQRMERAVKLLRTSKKPIQDIGREVGFKDTAYFCRRFKMMFGISAGRMRKQEIPIGL